jgi:hypothetical protein
VTLKRRAVVEADRAGKHFRLKLECGHSVVKRDNGHKDPPRKTACDACAILLDRCRAQDGWFMARTVGGLLPALKLLEAEGLVESSKQVHSTTLHWKVKR